MRMVEQNGGKFQRQKNHKKIAFGRNQKIFPETSVSWCVELDKKIKKIRYGHFKPNQKSKEK